MIKKRSDEVQKDKVTMANSKKTYIQWLITKEDGANRFTMRRFEILPGGEIGLHEHPEEHEIYIVSGKGKIIDSLKKKIPIIQGDVIYVPPNESHGYECEGAEPLIFICVIPYLEKV